MDDHPSRHSDEVKAFAIACRLAGDSYPTIQRKLSETLNESASLSTNWQWCQQSPATEGEHTARQLQMIAQQRLEIALKAGTLVEKRLAEARPQEAAIIWGIASDKVDSLLRIAQERNARNDLQEAIQLVLRLPQREQEALAAGIVGEEGD